MAIGQDWSPNTDFLPLLLKMNTNLTWRQTEEKETPATNQLPIIEPTLHPAPTQVPQLPWMSLPVASGLGNLTWLHLAHWPPSTIWTLESNGKRMKHSESMTIALANIWWHHIWSGYTLTREEPALYWRDRVDHSPVYYHWYAVS